jgi:hypothetical protein
MEYVPNYLSIPVALEVSQLKAPVASDLVFPLYIWGVSPSRYIHFPKRVIIASYFFQIVYLDK